MLKAVSPGDWAMLALSCATFVPGMKGATKGLRAFESLGKASKAFGKVPAGFREVVVKKGTRVYRAGCRIGSGFEHGSSYTLKSMKGMTRSEIIEKCGIPTELTKNPVSHHLTYVANRDFKAYSGTSVGGTWPELRLAPGQGQKVLDLEEIVDIPL